MSIRKTPTGIVGLDQIAAGGVPTGRTTLVAGSAGSGKTVLSGQFLALGIQDFDEPGIFVTFEERPEAIVGNLEGFGWPIRQWVDEDRLVFIDASLRTAIPAQVIGPYDFAALMARIEAAVKRTGARRVVFDSIGAVLTILQETALVRRELQRLAHAVSEMGVTALVTSERTEEYGPIARFGVEQFVADDVIILRHVLQQEQVRRTVQILKFRGTTHRKGEFPFTIDPRQGIVVLPLGERTGSEPSTDVRVRSGNSELDAMCGGGFMRDSLILVSGATGTGKTLTATAFLGGGAEDGDRGVFFGFEESREQLFRNAAGWGVDFAALEAAGRLRVVSEYPEVMALEDHLLTIRDVLDEVQPTRITIDSLSALEHMSTVRGFRQFMMGLTALMKERSITALFTATTPTLLGGESITVSHISTLTDSIILLRYVEVFGEVKRGLTVLKMRGSGHDKQIREVRIDGDGMHIGDPFQDVEGILGGAPTRVGTTDDRLRTLFSED